MDRNRNLRSNTKLTEFAPLSPEANEPGVGFQLLSKFFNFSKDDSPSESISSTSSNNSPKVSAKMSSSRKPPDRPSSGTSKAMAVSHFAVNISEGRSLPNVLKRISNLLALKSNSLQSYKDTDFKQYWMPDSVSRECYDCEEKFTTFRRRHHCRVCGQIFCSKCCNQEIPGKIMGCTGDLRVCTYCCKVVLSYLQSSDMGADLTSDLRALQEDLQTKFGAVGSAGVQIAPSGAHGAHGGSAEAPESAVPRRKLSVGFQEDKFALGRAQGTGYLSMEERCLALQKSASLRTLFEDLCQPTAGVALQTHRFRLRNYHSCFLGSELVDWLIAQSRAGTRVQGSAIGQALIEAGYLEPIAERGFADGYTLYRPREAALVSPGSSVPSAQESHDAPEPLWVKQIPQQDSATSTDSDSEAQLSDVTSSGSLPSSSSTFYLDLNVEDNVVHLSRPRQPGEGEAGAEEGAVVKGKQDATPVTSPAYECLHSGMSSELLMLQSTRSREVVPSSGWHNPAELRTDNGELEAYSRLSCAFTQHELGLCKQLLNAEGLSQNWLDVIVPLTRRIVDTIRPDVRNEADEMDIRQYVQLKKVPGGARSESTIVSGAVCTKNVAHRGMAVRLTDPRILLLGCSIVYQRIEGRLMTIEPVMMQEHEYLRHVVQRIAALRPDIILVHRAVSRLAQDFFLALKVTLVLHVKASVLERVSRLTHADIATSVDAHIGRPRLGTCRQFYLKTFQGQKGSASKTLMFFEDCAYPHLGCTVLLRGAGMGELSRVKRVTRRMLFARYNWRLEKSFLMDEFARPPSPPTDSFFGDEANKSSEIEERSFVGSIDSHSTAARQSTPLKVLVAGDGTNTCDITKDIPSNDLRKKLGGSEEELPTDVIVKYNKSDDCERSAVATKESVAKESDTSADKPKPATKDSDSETCDARANVRPKEKSTNDDKRINVESISDFSDPLHQYMNLEDEVFASGQHNVAAGPEMAVAELPLNNRFRKALDDTILSVSPFLKFSVPYLETEQGRNCVLRQYFPHEVYSSAQFSERPPCASGRSGGANATDNGAGNHDGKLDESKLLPQHPFASAKLTCSVDSDEVQTLLAAYRSHGGRVPLPREPARTVSTCEEPREQAVVAATTDSTDALDHGNHQKLAVLFCSYSHHSANAPAFCVNPWVVHMDFYGRNDIPLGSFLERYCFRPSYACPSEACEAPMLQHVRRFVHDAGCVHIALKQLDKATAAEQGHVLMWSWCTRCQTASPVVPMSTDTWGLSFAKYLELRFHGQAHTLRGGQDNKCCHSLHHDHYQYFSCKNIVASFKYTDVGMWEVSLPPPMISIFYNPRQHSDIIEEIKRLALQGYDIYSSVLERICALGNEVEGVSSLKQQRSHEHAILKSCIEEIQLKLTSPTLESKKLEGKIAEKEVQQLMWRIEDAVTQLKLEIADAVCSWNARIQEFVASSRKREDKSRKSTDSNKLTAHSSSHSLETSVTSVSSRLSEDSRVDSATPASSVFEDQGSTTEGPDSLDRVSVSSINLPGASETLASESEKETQAGCGTSDEQRDATLLPQDTAQPAPAFTLPDVGMMSSFESTASDFEAQRAMQTVKDVSEDAPNSAASQPPPSHGSPRLPDSSRSDTPTAVDDSHDAKQPAHASVDKKSVKTIIMAQLRPSAHVYTPIQSPLSPQEHHLPVHGCVIPTIVYENEPSSIIAYALSSLDYRRSLDDIRFKKSTNEQASPLLKRKSGSLLTDKDASSELTASVESRRSAVLSFLRGSNTNGISPIRTGILDGVQYTTTAVVGEPTQDTEESKTEADKGKGSKYQQSNLYIEVQFNDTTTNFFCRVYFAEPFAALRQMVLPAGEDAYVRSLARCVQWAARGGKSGSTFCKTKDDRFILKEMPRNELQLFLEFAPHYFSYVMRCHAARQPTLLGKIVGVYRVVYRNAATNATMKSNLLVMENLFYARSVTHKFDLKGSVRNRLVNPADDHLGEIVLLDENLLKMTCESPLYMLPHSKSVLTQAIDNDTQFLASQEVMDYSLLVGLDQDKRELVVGIIDYIRTFTWDKKLETMVKSSGILGGQGKLPTVVSPELYRARFITSMHQYFLPVPDRWAGLGRDLE